MDHRERWRGVPHVPLATLLLIGCALLQPPPVPRMFHPGARAASGDATCAADIAQAHAALAAAGSAAGDPAAMAGEHAAAAGAMAAYHVCLAHTSTGPGSAAWPHRARLTALHQRPVVFHAWTIGGELIFTVDASGHRTDPAMISRVRALSVRDTIRAETPADFPLDLLKGPVVFVADGGDSLQLTVGRNPYGSVDPVSATGRKFTVRLVDDRFVIEAR